MIYSYRALAQTRFAAFAGVHIMFFAILLIYCPLLITRHYHSVSTFLGDSKNICYIRDNINLHKHV